jgi:hypothetical protein
MLLGLLLERLGVGEVSFSRREVEWGMSGTWVHVDWDGQGNVKVWLSRIGCREDMGPYCPWPPEKEDRIRNGTRTIVQGDCKTG